MDLTPYTCRGFPGDLDRMMRDVPVGGIDRAQTQSMIRLCDETEPILYGQNFSPERIHYRVGARPKLEAIAAGFNRDVASAMRWTRDHVRHPHFAGDVRPDRALSEEELIASGVGWCNEQCRVFIALCEVMQIPARLCFLFHANGRTGHTATEVFLERSGWRFFDVTFGIAIPLEARQLWRRDRRRADALYAEPLRDYYRNHEKPPIDVDRGGDFFQAVGITNYLIDGIEAVNAHE